MENELDRYKLIQEIARHVNADANNLNFLISTYNLKYPGLNATVDDFSIRVAKTPEEACTIGVTIIIPKVDEKLSVVQTTFTIPYYQKLLTYAFHHHYDQLRPCNIGKLTWEDLETWHKNPIESRT